MQIKAFKRAEDTSVFDKVQKSEKVDLDDNDNVDAHAGPPVAETGQGTAEVDDAETTEAPEAGCEEGGAQNPTPPRGRRLLRRILAGMVGVVVIAALSAAALLGWQLKQRDDTAAAGRAALATAQSYAVTLTSVDATNIDQNFAQVLDGATGEFKDMYSQSASQLRQVLIDNKATSHGTVVDAAIKSASKTRVEVLVFVDQSISNVVNPQPRIDRSRVAMTMELVDNRWLASKVDIK